MPGLTSKSLRLPENSVSPSSKLHKMGPHTVSDAAWTVSAAMEKEEEQMRLKREKEEMEREEILKKERDEELQGGPEVTDNKFKALEFLLSQSKVSSSVYSVIRTLRVFFAR